AECSASTTAGEQRFAASSGAIPVRIANRASSWSSHTWSGRLSEGLARTVGAETTTSPGHRSQNARMPERVLERIARRFASALTGSDCSSSGVVRSLNVAGSQVAGSDRVCEVRIALLEFREGAAPGDPALL